MDVDDTQVADEGTQVVDNDAPADNSDSAPDDQGQSLDDLLNEFKNDTNDSKDEAAANEGESEVDAKKIKDEVKEEMRQERIIQEDINSSIKEVKGDAPVADEWIQAIMESEAKKDPRVLNAFLQRKDNPKGWDAYKNDLTKRIGTSFSKAPNKAETDMKGKVLSAVNTSNSTPNTGKSKNVFGMSTVDASDYKDSILK